MNETWTEGWLPDGTHIHVDGDPYSGDGVLRINGEIVEPLPGPLGVGRYRDGGSTYIKTARGELYCHRRMRDQPFDSWEGTRLLTEPPSPPGKPE